MRVVTIMKSKPNDFTFTVESDTNKNIIDEIENELMIFGFTSKSSYPSPRKYPSAIRIIGASNYWSHEMIWICFSNKIMKIILIPEKMIKNMNELEHEDYQKNYDLMNEVIEHFLQIAMRNA